MGLIISNKNKITLLLLFFLLLISLSSDLVEGFRDDKQVEPTYSFHKEIGMQMRGGRKLLAMDAMLDYDDAGANPRHDPRKKGGSGSGGKP
ncbi:uncharacterized protein LOC110823467 [Carica papaya]|uniref:uncharacterized protein LOC110823467 n=1 Tax=Carica papaya TaxID=3649 RepID=UPI000B8CE30C|nr:uncharacterized protein LOC110823467 [Carica papaya]